MSLLIGILEDDVEGRIPAFRAATPLVLTGNAKLVICNSAPEFIDWLETAWSEVALISLDHDLGMPQEREGRTVDPGCGMDVVRKLARREAKFPVIVHSSNPVAAERMMCGLFNSGWIAHRLPPFGDAWIKTAWTNAANRLLLR